MSFGLIAFTNRGRALQAKAQAGTQLNFTRIAVGDGQLSGQAIADLTVLIHEIKSIPLNKFKVLPGGKAVVGGVLSNQDIETGFWWRELGLFAQDPDLGEILYCYGNAGDLAEYIPSPGGAEILEKQVDIVSVIGNAQNVSASIEQSLVYATVQDLTAHKEDHEKHIDYAVASGADDYIITIPGITQLVEGMSIKVKFTNANTGACTLNINGIGAVSIKKSNGNDLAASNIKAGQICHLVYTGSVFQLLGEGGGEYGTALPEHVLEGYTIGTEEGIKSGTMPNRGAVTHTITTQGGSYTIPSGYHNGSGKVTASFANLVAENIKKGINVGGVVGTLKPGDYAVGDTIGDSVLRPLPGGMGAEIWSKTDERYGHGIAVDSAGNVYVAHYVDTSGKAVRKLDPNGNEIWSKTDVANGNSIAVDSAGNVYVTHNVSSGKAVWKLDGNKYFQIVGVIK